MVLFFLKNKSDGGKGAAVPPCLSRLLSPPAMKADRKRLKSEKTDLVSQMQQLYATLESREEQLRDFIRNYEQHRKVSLGAQRRGLVALGGGWQPRECQTRVAIGQTTPPQKLLQAGWSAKAALQQVEGK